MDKKKSSKGAVKILKHEKQVMPHPHCHSSNRNFFKVEENDFPSLSEVCEKNPKSEKDSSTYSASSFSYSSKLKVTPAESSSSQNMKFENVHHHCEPKVESVSSKGLLKYESSFSNVDSRLMAKPSQSNQENLAKPPTSAAYNVRTSSNRKTFDSKLNHSFSEAKNTKSDCFNESTNTKTLSDNRLSKTAHGESNTFEEIRHSPRKGHNLSNTAAVNVQKFPVSKSLSSPRKSNAEYSSTLRSNVSCYKESDRPNINTQRKHMEVNRSVNSNVRNSQVSSRLLQTNVMHGKVSGNTSNNARTLSNPGSVKMESYVSGNPSGIAQLTSTNAGRKKRKRKSKLKRQAALQTGKILFLTPEIHSKIINQSNNVCLQKHQNVFTNINDSEEYPELGIAESKTIKKSNVAVTNVQAKEENTTDLLALGSEAAKENLLPKDSSVNENLEVATKSEEQNNGPFERSEGEKSSIHSNDPITLSLFDMLRAAKLKKKEPEKTDESTEENSALAKNSKKEIIKKSVLQAVNPLASSKPTIKRGKEREKPKVKRPSRMRKLILMERQLRKETLATKILEAEDENHETSEEILLGIHDINEFSTSDNIEANDKNLINYVINLENGCETYDIYDDINNKISEQFEVGCKDANFCPTSKKNPIEEARLEKEMLNNINQFVESQIANSSNDKNDFISKSDSIVDVQNDFVANHASNLTNIEKNFEEDFADINIVEHSTKISRSAIGELSEKHSEWKNSINNTCCINEHLMENDTKNDDTCQTYNFMNRMQKLDGKITDITENIIPGIEDININDNVEFNVVQSESSEVNQCSENFGQRIESSEANQYNENLDKRSESSDANQFSKNLDQKIESSDANQYNENLDSFEKVTLSISVNSFPDKDRLKAIKLMLHSRKFRQYCNHFISKEIDQAVFSLIDDLARFQDRMYQKDPVKAKVRRRLVYGLKEIKKHMKLKKVKCIIIATDIEDIKIEGGLNDSLGELISLAEAYHIPCVFSHLRFNLGKVCRKSVPVSCVGIFNYEGSEKNFKKMIELHDDSKHDYIEVTKKLASELTDNQVKELFESEKKSIIFLREVSQRILKEMVYFTPEGYRNNVASELEKSTSVKAEDFIEGFPQKPEDSNVVPSDEMSQSWITKKLDKDESLLQLNESDVNTILVKYKVVKES